MVHCWVLRFPVFIVHCFDYAAYVCVTMSSLITITMTTTTAAAAATTIVTELNWRSSKGKMQSYIRFDCVLLYFVSFCFVFMHFQKGEKGFSA